MARSVVLIVRTLSRIANSALGNGFAAWMIPTFVAKYEDDKLKVARFASRLKNRSLFKFSFRGLLHRLVQIC